MFVCVSAACVNCVRWSNNGLYLASGGDDKLVMVWKRAAYVYTQSLAQYDKQHSLSVKKRLERQPNKDVSMVTELKAEWETFCVSVNAH